MILDARTDWTQNEIAQLFALPLPELIYQAQAVMRKNFPTREIQASALLSIKTGGCPENCKYCPQSAHYNTGLGAEKLMETAPVIEAAKQAKSQGATRFCMGAAWREPKERDMPKLLDMLKAVKAEGLETCMTLGMLSKSQADRFAEAGLDFYNHNLDSSKDFYEEIISTRSYQERLDTLTHVRDAGLHVCCGGILGMGESLEDRIALYHTLATLPKHPESVPINRLVQIDGTPLEKAQHTETLSDIEFARAIAVARIVFAQSYIRLSAGREEMSDTAQALCLLAGANSFFYGEQLLTTPNPDTCKDKALLAAMGLQTEATA